MISLSAVKQRTGVMQLFAMTNSRLSKWHQPIKTKEKYLQPLFTLSVITNMYDRIMNLCQYMYKTIRLTKRHQPIKTKEKNLQPLFTLSVITNMYDRIMNLCQYM